MRVIQARACACLGQRAAAGFRDGQGQRAGEPTTRFGGQAVPSRHGEAAELPSRQGRAALVEQRRRL